jgi:hypothetical protein
VPCNASFPVYDFFVLHKVNGLWIIKAGYQCKQGTQHPTVEASSEKVPLAVWIEGKCRQYRARGDDRLVAIANVRGWKVLSESYQADMLGVSVSEALPAKAPEIETTRRCDYCLAEQYWEDKRAEAVESSSQEQSEGDEQRQGEPSSKKSRAT